MCSCNVILCVCASAMCVFVVCLCECVYMCPVQSGDGKKEANFFFLACESNCNQEL